MNASLFYFFYDFAHRSNLLDRIVFLVAEEGDKVVLFLAIVFLVYFFAADRDWRDKKWIAWMQECVIIFASIVSAYGVAYVIKIIAQTPRPFIALADVVPLIQHGGYDSFPSGHATVFFALATAIYLYNKKVGYGFFVFAVLIALSRVIAGVHYPLDIAAGAIIGVLVGYLTHKFLSRLVKFPFLGKSL